MNDIRWAHHELWPHQQRGIAEVHSAIAAGKRKIVLTSPTGGGKSKMIGTLLSDYVSIGQPAILYTNKKMLTSQNADVLTGMGLEYGVRADGHETDFKQLIQIASIQTEHSRVQRAKVRALHKAALVIVEEAHVQMGPTVRTILNRHLDEGAAIVGVTATPLDMGEYYDHLVVAGSNSELRACGALVPAVHYGADEPDLKAMKIKETDGNNLSEAQQKKAIMTKTVFARVGEWFEKLNPERHPTVLFGPGVEESLWFAEKFREKYGFGTAHIDGSDVWINGVFYKADDKARKAVEEGSKSGDIVIVSNRYVLREGVNWPWVRHGILAYVVGSFQTFLQIGGRFLRAYPGKEYCTIQDHGGAWWKFGSLNADRVWDLRYTNTMVAGLRGERIRKKREMEPWRCPCGRIMIGGKACECGRPIPPKKSRPVVMADGELREMVGDIYRPRRVYSRPDGRKKWESMYFRSRTEKGNRTFRAAMALFAKESHFGWPDSTWPFMPKDEMDSFLLCSDVPRERLH